MIRGGYQTQFLQVRNGLAMYFHPALQNNSAPSSDPGPIYFEPKCFHEYLSPTGSRIGECFCGEHFAGNSIDNCPPTDYYQMELYRLN